jgi:Leucine-rich repeat (LRR) protein
MAVSEEDGVMNYIFKVLFIATLMLVTNLYTSIVLASDPDPLRKKSRLIVTNYENSEIVEETSPRKERSKRPTSRKREDYHRETSSSSPIVGNQDSSSSKKPRTRGSVGRKGFKDKVKTLNVVKSQTALQPNTQLPHFDQISSAVFWTHFGSYLTLRDIENLYRLSKTMKTQMTQKITYLININRDHYEQFGIKGFEQVRLEFILRFSVPLIEISLAHDAPHIAEVRDAIIRSSRRTVSQLNTANLYYFPTLNLSLEHLKELNLKGCNLEVLPKCLTQLTNLETLDISKNHLTALPTGFKRLQNLQVLEIWSNRFSEFPLEVLSCESLKSLNFGANQLTEFPLNVGQLLKLKELWLSGNQLKQLPPEITQLKNLRSLYIRRNYQIQSLPPEMTEMKNLRKVCLKDTGIKKRMMWSEKWISTGYGGEVKKG